jgi:hypothetical protein
MYIKRNLLLAALFLLWNGSAGWADDLEVSKKKEIKRAFPVTQNDRLSVNNRYGNVTITHWTKDEVDIRVVVESKAGNERRAQEMLDRVQIELKKSGNTVYGVTSIKSRAGWGNYNLTINYYIAMPSRLDADLSVSYGGINLPEDNGGKYDIKIAYGNLKAGNFTQPVDIDARYSQVTLGDADNLQMDLEYCGSVSVKNSRTAEIESEYSNIRLRNAGRLHIRNAHGDIQIENVDKLSAETVYSKVRIGCVKEELHVGSLDYSTMTVERLDADGFRNAQVKSSYSTLKLSVSPKAAFRVIAEGMRYGSVNVKGLKITESKEENKSNYSYRINGGQDRQIRFKGHYSHLKINAL